MNQQMWSAAATQVNLRLLLERGIVQIGPADGLQACGECGPGRMLEPDQIADQVTAIFRNGRLSDLWLLVTAGPTREAIDPVRFISNYSSGKMGYAIARAGVEAGAKVTLVSGPSSLSSPVGVERILVVSTEEMHAEVMSRASEADIFIGAAAVADYRVEEPSEVKLKKNAGRLDLSLVRTPDILAEVAALPNDPFTAGFAAETNDVERNARDKLSGKALDLIAANQVGVPGTGFDSDENVVTLYWNGGEKALARAPKLTIARMLIDSIADRYHEKRAAKNP
jgi:phosphopantothenoylcysteine decarboxylase/phosphopantothenate--cysteine ligase